MALDLNLAIYTKSLQMPWALANLTLALYPILFFAAKTYIGCLKTDCFSAIYNDYQESCLQQCKWVMGC